MKYKTLQLSPVNDMRFPFFSLGAKKKRKKKERHIIDYEIELKISCQMARVLLENKNMDDQESRYIYIYISV